MWSLFPLVLALFCVPTADSKDDAATQALKMLQGTWAPVAYTVAGQPAPAETLRALQLTVQGTTSTLKHEQQVSQGTYKLDANQQPKALDIVVTAGPGKGTTKLAIYEVDGANLKICLDPTGKTRPKEFASTASNGYVLEVWKKVARP